jgi:hypothetical protein
MSVLFLPPSAGAASVPDASETVSGKIRIATSAEATAGTNDLTAMTPLKTKSVVDAAVVGGVTYQGTFDASSPADLSNAEKGDLYIISVAGTYQGQTWAVGDHLLINADMGGTLDPAKIDKVDNTDSVTSVAGRTGAVTLSTADISGLATVASTGAYSDLTGAPTLATVATTGAYSDLSGTPTLGTAAAEDVGTLAGNVVQLDGTAKLPAVDGSQLTNLPSAPVTSVAGKTGAVTLVAGDISGLATVATTGAYSDLTGTPTLGTAAAEDVGTLAGNVVQLNGSAQLPAVDGSLLTGITASVVALNDVGDVNAPTPANTNVIKYNSTSGDWESGAVAASEVSGLATVATTGAYSDLSGTPTNVSTFTNDAGYLTEANTVVLQYNSTTTATAVSSKDLHVYRLYGAGGFTLTVSATASNGLVEINNISSSACTISGPTFRLNGEGVTGGSTSITVEAGERRIFYLESTSTWLEANATFIDRLADVSITSPSNGEALVYNSTSGDWENGTVSASVAALNDIGDVSAPTPANTNVIKYNSISGDWESGAVAYAEVTGTPTLGTAAALDVGTSANNVVQLNGSAQLPAVDGSLLTGITATVAALNDIGDVSAAAPNNGDVIAYNSTSGDWEATAQSGGGSAPSVTVSSPSADQTLTTPSGIEEVYIYTPTTAITVNLVAAATCGSGFKYQIKNRTSNAMTITPNGSETIDGAASYVINISENSVTLVTDGSNWFII